MSDVVIRSEGLGKKYLVGHQSKQERYTALRDVVTRTTKRFARSAIDIARGKQLVACDEIEEFWALKEISFEIKRGEVVGIIGRNGAGKSTLLKILSRITEPSEGRVEIKGRVASLLEVGTGFHPELTGRENIYLNGAILGMTRAEIRNKFDEIVAFAEIEKFLDTPVKRYSSGMYVRLAFAVAAHLEPEILVVDEVLAVGDAEFQKKCLGKMGEVAGHGRTVLFVSHNVGAVEQLCTMALLLRGGCVERISTNVREVTREYLIGVTGATASEWHASQERSYDNPYFTPTRFRVADHDNTDRRIPATAAEPLDIIIEGKVQIEDSGLNIGYALYSETGAPLFWSFTSDTSPQTWPILSKGDIRLRTTIPARLLNEGTYRIELLASLHNRLWILEPGTSVPSIVATVQGSLSESPHFTAPRPTVISPIFPWFAEPSQ